MPRWPRSPTICGASCAATPCWRDPIRRGSAPSARSAGIARRRRSTLLGLVVAILAGTAALLWRQERALEAQERRDRAIERLVVRRRRAGRSPAGQPARSARRARHGGGGHRPRLRIRPALDGSAALGRRRARRDHRVRGGARRHPRAGRRRGPAGGHGRRLRDARHRRRARAPGPRRQRRARAPRGRAPAPACTSCGPASRAASSSPCLRRRSSAPPRTCARRPGTSRPATDRTSTGRSSSTMATATRSWRSAPRSSATAAAGSGPRAWSSPSITSSPTSSRRGRCATPR